MLLFIILLIIIFLFVYNSIYTVNYMNERKSISNNYRNTNFLRNNSGIYWEPNVCDPYYQPCYRRYRYINGYFYPTLSNRYILPMY